MTPAGATWSVMPAGTPSDAFDPHGGAETLSADVFDLIAGDELAIFDAALDVWAATSGFTNLGMRADSGDPINTPEPGPGNTLFGDIRIGAYGIDGLFGRLAHAYQPGTADTFLTTPTIGGDMHFDSAEIWADDPTDTAADSDFDLFTVSLHEFGHSLGLAHSSIGGSVMWPYYGGALRTLQPDDIAGIQAIYGSAEVIPEPGTIALFSLGLFGMLGYGIRRKKKSS